MKVLSTNCTFDYSWAEVSSANWSKYSPINTKSSHVIAVDTLSRTVDPKTGILRTERLITCKQSAPEWMRSLMGSGMEVSHMYEASYVDPVAQTVTMVSQNLTWNNLLNVEETVIYRPFRQAGKLVEGVTEFSQEAKITALCGGWARIKHKIEDAVGTRFRENAKTGREGFEMVLAMSRRVFAEERERERLAKMTLS